MARLEMPTLIARKRDGGELSPDEVRAIIEAYVGGDVDDAQMAALLMAGVIRGFTTTEAVALTDAFVRSGDTVDLSALRGPTVDKHSTGGVGDVTTLVVAPLLAAAGCQVAKLSGRGLGHTGGTLDKLESIPGFTVDLSPDQLARQVEDIGLAVAAATQDLVPADRRLYALRDVTGTVPSDALIAASVMSKKIAGGAGHVLLDVKAGSGAFMERPDDARRLAQLCVDIGEAHGRRTGALVTDMSQPLGDAVGNALEVVVAVETLQGRRGGRLRDLCVELAAATLSLTGVGLDEARDRVVGHLDDGTGLERFAAFVAAQHGDPRVAEDPASVLPVAPVVQEWTGRDGTIAAFACRRLGELAGLLGAGRQRRSDPVDPAVGLEVFGRIGDQVDGVAPVVRIHARSEPDARRVAEELDQVVVISDDPVAAPALIVDRVGLER
ncbi:MAG: thymidine phosphorylase [Nitriliruptoraceae bacterium]